MHRDVVGLEPHRSSCYIAVADPGFLDRGSAILDKEAPFWIGGTRLDGTAVCRRKLKKNCLKLGEGAPPAAPRWIRH